MKKLLSILLASSMLTGICAAAAEAEPEYETESAAAENEKLLGGADMPELMEISDEKAAELRETVDREKGEAVLSEAEEPATFFSFAEDCGYAYRDAARNSKPQTRQELYVKLLDICREFETDRRDLSVDDNDILGREICYLSGFEYSDLLDSEIREVFRTFTYDHPEFYWLDNCLAYSGSSILLCVYGDFADGEARRTADADIDSNVRTVIDEINSQSFCCDYERIKYIGSLLRRRCKYAYDEYGYPETAHWAHSITGVFDNNSETNAVGEGYSKAGKLIFDAFGIKNVIAANNTNMWNLVKMYDGYHYIVDITNRFLLCGQQNYPWEPYSKDQTGYGYLYDLPAVSDTEYKHIAHKEIPTFAPEVTPNPDPAPVVPTPKPTFAPKPVNRTSPERYYTKVNPVGHGVYGCPLVPKQDYDFFYKYFVISGIVRDNDDPAEYMKALYDGNISNASDDMVQLSGRNKFAAIIDLGDEYDLKALKLYNVTASFCVGFAVDDYEPGDVGKLGEDSVSFDKNWFYISDKYDRSRLFETHLSYGEPQMDEYGRTEYSEVTMTGEIGSCRYICLLADSLGSVYCSEIEAYIDEGVSAAPIKIEAMRGTDDETGDESVQIMLSEPASATLTAAQYDEDGRFITSVQIPAEKDKTDYTAEMPHEDNSTVRVMLWENSSSMRPFADAITAQ